MTSLSASRLPMADVVRGVFKLLAGDGCTVLPTAFARSHLAQAVVLVVARGAESCGILRHSVDKFRFSSLSAVQARATWRSDRAAPGGNKTVP